MSTYMIVAMKIFVSLVAAMLIVIWARWFIQPEAMYALYDVTANSRFGVNMLKSDMGGFVLTIGFLSLLAVWRGGSWYPPALIAQAAILFTRVLSLLQDGATAGIWGGIALETVVFAVTFALFRNDRASV